MDRKRKYGNIDSGPTKRSNVILKTLSREKQIQKNVDFLSLYQEAIFPNLDDELKMITLVGLMRAISNVTLRKIIDKCLQYPINCNPETKYQIHYSCLRDFCVHCLSGSLDEIDKHYNIITRFLPSPIGDSLKSLICGAYIELAIRDNYYVARYLVEHFLLKFDDFDKYRKRMIDRVIYINKYQGLLLK